MKFLRFLCNIFLFFLTAVVVSIVQVGTYDLVAAQSSNVEAVHIVPQTDEQVGYIDTYTFWAEDIATGIQTEEKYRIRSWFDVEWWQNGMGWADKGLDIAIAAVKPIFVPVAQINAVKNYYRLPGDNLFSDTQCADIVKAYGSLNKANDELYNVYSVLEKGFVKEDVKVAKIIETETGSGKYTIGDEPLEAPETAYEGSYASWVKKNTILYNHLWKLKKYNCGSYGKYFKKFIKSTSGSIDDRNIKTPAVMLYYQQYVAMIIAFIFVLKYPVVLAQVKVEGGDPDKQRKRLGFGRKK